MKEYSNHVFTSANGQMQIKGALDAVSAFESVEDLCRLFPASRLLGPRFCGGGEGGRGVRLG